MTTVVPALARGLRVLQFLASRPGPVAASAIARELSLARSTIYDVLGELAAAGFVTHLPHQRRWGLGPAAFEVGSAYLRSQPLAQLATVPLAHLATSTGGSAHLGVLHGAETMYLARERSPRSPTLVTHVGVRLPAALTATGLVMLAYLPTTQVTALFPHREAFIARTERGITSASQLRTALREVRHRGWAIEDGAIASETASLAAAVFDHNQRPAAALGLTIAHRCPASSESDGCGTELTEYSTLVRSAAAAVTAAIGGSIPPSSPRSGIRH